MIFSIIGQLLLGWLFADLVGGLLHYIEDRQLLPAFLDRHIGLPNRLHHTDPQGVTRDPNFLRRNSTTFAAAMPVIIGVYLVSGAGLFWLAASVGGLMSYEVHRWAHAPRLAPRWATVLQEIGLFQSPKHHAVHHRPPHLTGFCILTDWLNPVLDVLGFWRLLGLIPENERFKMHVISAIIALLGVLALAIGAAIWFAPTDNVDAAALAKIPAMIVFAIGVVLLVVALIVRLL